MIVISAWAKFFLLTVALESAVCVRLLGPRYSVGRRLLAVLFAQLLTHPVAWFVLSELGLSIAAYSLLAETWAVGLELAFYRFAFSELSWRRTLGISAFANGLSYFVGLLLQ